MRLFDGITGEEVGGGGEIARQASEALREQASNGEFSFASIDDLQAHAQQTHFNTVVTLDGQFDFKTPLTVVRIEEGPGMVLCADGEGNQKNIPWQQLRNSGAITQATVGKIMELAGQMMGRKRTIENPPPPN